MDVVDAYLRALPGEARRLAHAEWGLTVPAAALGGEELDIGLRISDGMLRAKAVALHADAGVDPWMLLWWNRQTRHVRFGCGQDRGIWVHADLPVAAVDEREVDRLLGLVAEGVIAVRGYAQRVRDTEEAPAASWLPNDG